MNYKYVLLKEGRGIVIFVEMEELLRQDIVSTDLFIDNGVYLRISDNDLLKSMLPAISFWIVNGIKDVLDKVRQVFTNLPVCYYLQSIEFDRAHFQEEGLYCAVQEWVGMYYKVPIPKVRAEYSIELEKFIFSINK